MKNDRISTIQKVLKKGEVILLDSTFDIFSVLSLDESYNVNEYDCNMLISKKKVYLISESLFYPYLKDIKGINVVEADNEAYLENGKLFRKEIEEILKRESAIRLGVTNGDFARYFRKYVIFHFISPSRALGSVKSADEIRILKKCGKMLREINDYVETLIQPGISDIEIRNAIDLKIYETGSQRRYVPTMVGLDSKTMFPTLTGNRVKGNELIISDFGVMYKGLGLSISRTHASGKAGSRKMRVLELCNMALDVMEAELKPGVNANTVEKAYREFMHAHKLEKYACDYAVKLPGISYSENINSFSDRFIIRENSAVKLSASLFVPGMFGVRQERIVLVKKKGGMIIA